MEGFRDIAWWSSIMAHFELFTSNKVNMLKELKQALFTEAKRKWLVCEGDRSAWWTGDKHGEENKEWENHTGRTCWEYMLQSLIYQGWVTSPKNHLEDNTYATVVVYLCFSDVLVAATVYSYITFVFVIFLLLCIMCCTCWCQGHSYSSYIMPLNISQCVHF